MRTRSAVAVVLGVVAAAIAAAPSQAFQPPHDDGGMPNVDLRAAERAPVPAPTRAARQELQSDLGPLGDVRTDRKSGGVSYVGRTDALLTEPSSHTPREVVLDYVREHGEVFGLGKADVANLRLVARSVSPDGITHLRFNQVLDGILAFDSGIDGHVAADGRLINVSGAPVPGARLPETTPALGAPEGISAARDAVDGVDPGGERAALRWSATADGPRLAWSVIAEDADGRYYDVLVDAGSGDLLRRQNLTSQLGEARYFRADPLITPAQTQITMPPAWYDDHAGGTRLWGQYARTYTDPADQDPLPGSELGGVRAQIPASGGAPNAPDWLYSPSLVVGDRCPISGCTWDGSTRASAEVNQFQAATNVHVLTSRFHDHLLSAPIGFDEASGNFQRTNVSGRGFGNDYVRAEVNDGEGFNNANFGTPPDGSAPRMQMYLFNGYDVNGSDVADIVYHEYGHGLSNRLVVNASGGSTISSWQPAMMGEAWSDFYALDVLVHERDLTDTAAPGELTMGSYAVGPGGIRAKPIDCPVDPAGATPACNGTFGAAVPGGYTYGDLFGTNNATPHNGSEVWAQTLWEIRTAFGRDAALALITGGMRLSVDDPSMLDMRDAILQQAVAMRSAPGAADDRYAALWTIFRNRGFGANATTLSSNTLSPAEGSGAPSGLRTTAPAVLTDPYPGGDNDGEIEPGERFEVHQSVAGIGLVDLMGVTGTLTSGGPGATVEDGSAAWPVLGFGRQAPNADPLAARLAAQQCMAPTSLTIDATSSEGSAQSTVVVDPRPGTSAVVPLNDAGVAGGVTTATFEAAGTGNVTDVDVRIDELRHTYLGDLKVELIHAGVTATLFDRPGAGGYEGDDIVGAVFDSDGGSALPTTGSGPITGHFRTQPSNALDAFDGLPAGGTWTLRITDAEAQDTGVLHQWGLASPEVGCGRLEIPAAQTAAASDVLKDAATLGGSVTPNGRATGVRFAYGTTTAYGATTPVREAGAGDAAVPATAALSGLAPGTTYHYRVEAIREGGQVAIAGEDRTFTTAALPVADPPVVTPPVVNPPPAIGPPALTADVAAPRWLGTPRVTLAKVAGRRDRRRASFALRISEPATVAVVVGRVAPGIRKGARCVAIPRNRPRGAKPCKRSIPAARATVSLAPNGTGTLRLPAAGLKRGSYTAKLTATDAAGNRSAAVTVGFKVR